MRLTSTQNPTVKYVRSIDRASVRREEGVFLVEGVRLVAEAIETGQAPTIVLYDPATLTRSAAGSSLIQALSSWAPRAIEVDERVMRAAAQTETPSGILAVLRIPEPPPMSALKDTGMGLLLDTVSDPGNMGTILRTAAAFGIQYVIASPGSVDPFAPKVVRAGMGAHFRLPIYLHLSWHEINEGLSDHPVVALDAHRGADVTRFEWPTNGVLAVGSEAHGLSAVAADLVTFRVRIPMVRGVESLNVAVAASIAMYAARGAETSSG